MDVEEEWITKVEEVTSEGRREVEEARAMPQAGEEEEHGVEQRWLVRGREAVRAAASQSFRVRRHNIRAPHLCQPRGRIFGCRLTERFARCRLRDRDCYFYNGDAPD